MLASVLAVLALSSGVFAAQPTPPEDDGPVQTAPREAPASADPLPGLDDKQVDLDAAPAAKPEARPDPAPEPKAAPPAIAAAKALTVEQKTLVQGETLQIVLGQRAVFRLDDKGLPVLERVEEGKLADAHPEGEASEAFDPPGEGEVAAALDGSAEKRATVLKVWNRTDQAIDYSAIALVLRQGKVSPELAPICAVPAGETRTEIWPRPVVAVGLQRFKQTAAAKACNK